MFTNMVHLYRWYFEWGDLMRLSELDAYYKATIESYADDYDTYIDYKSKHDISADKEGFYTTNVLVKYKGGFGASLHPLYSLPNYHTHSFIEVMYVVKGKIINVIEGERFEMNKGDFCFLPPGIYHSVDTVSQTPAEDVLINVFISIEDAVSVLAPLFNDFVISDYLSSILYNKQYKKYAMLIASDPERTDLLMRMFHLAYIEEKNKHQIKTSNTIHSSFSLSNSKICTSLFCASLISALTSETHTFSLAKASAKSSVPATQIVSYIKSNYADICLEDISEKFNYSFAYTSKIIKQFTGVSFSKLLTEYRLDAACSLLSETELTVHEIAKKVGYGSTEHFHRVFKAEKGISPIEFRKGF